MVVKPENIALYMNGIAAIIPTAFKNTITESCIDINKLVNAALRYFRL